MEIFSQNLNTTNQVAPGDFLLAEPMLSDSNFQRTVILMCDHQEEGSFGLVVNKLANASVGELDNILPLNDNLYIGGPVQQNTLHFIHKIPDLEGAIPLKDGLFWGGDYEELKTMSLAGKVTSTNCRFFLGYSGWGKEQLAGELKQNSWVISSANPSIIFDVPADNLWENILHEMGGRYKMFVNFPTDASLN